MPGHEHHHDNHQHENHHDTADPTDFAAMAQLLDLDADVLHPYLDDVVAWVEQWAPDGVRRLVDLGAGTGNGTVVLAQHFGQAEVIALDSSPDLLARLTAKALDLGLADRIRTVHADLDATWPALDQVDVVWASLFMHHLSDPGRALADVRATLRPGGVMAIVEMNSPPRFLPEDIGLGRPGLEARCHAALDDEPAASMPNLGTDWASHLEAAGYVVLDERRFTLVASPTTSATGRYARTYLHRVRAALEDRLAGEDLATLDTLLAEDGPHSLLQREDLFVRGTRTGWIGRPA